MRESKVSYNAIKKNTRLTDFSDIKEVVIAHTTAMRKKPYFETKSEGNEKSLHAYLR